jgi:hypothetical protein
LYEESGVVITSKLALKGALIKAGYSQFVGIPYSRIPLGELTKAADQAGIAYDYKAITNFETHKEERRAEVEAVNNQTYNQPAQSNTYYVGDTQYASKEEAMQAATNITVAGVYDKFQQSTTQTKEVSQPLFGSSSFGSSSLRDVATSSPTTTTSAPVFSTTNSALGQSMWTPTSAPKAAPPDILGERLISEYNMFYPQMAPAQPAKYRAEMVQFGYEATDVNTGKVYKGGDIITSLESPAKPSAPYANVLYAQNQLAAATPTRTTYSTVSPETMKSIKSPTSTTGKISAFIGNYNYGISQDLGLKKYSEGYSLLMDTTAGRGMNPIANNALTRGVAKGIVADVVEKPVTNAVLYGVGFGLGGLGAASEYAGGKILAKEGLGFATKNLGRTLKYGPKVATYAGLGIFGGATAAQTYFTPGTENKGRVLGSAAVSFGAMGLGAMSYGYGAAKIKGFKVSNTLKEYKNQPVTAKAQQEIMAVSAKNNVVPKFQELKGFKFYSTTESTRVGTTAKGVGAILKGEPTPLPSGYDAPDAFVFEGARQTTVSKSLGGGGTPGIVPSESFSTVTPFRQGYKSASFSDMVLGQPSGSKLNVGSDFVTQVKFKNEPDAIKFGMRGYSTKGTDFGILSTNVKTQGTIKGYRYTRLLTGSTAEPQYSIPENPMKGLSFNDKFVSKMVIGEGKAFTFAGVTAKGENYFFKVSPATNFEWMRKQKKPQWNYRSSEPITQFKPDGSMNVGRGRRTATATILQNWDAPAYDLRLQGMNAPPAFRQQTSQQSIFDQQLGIPPAERMRDMSMQLSGNKFGSMGAVGNRGRFKNVFAQSSNFGQMNKFKPAQMSKTGQVSGISSIQMPKIADITGVKPVQNIVPNFRTGQMPKIIQTPKINILQTPKITQNIVPGFETPIVPRFKTFDDIVKPPKIDEPWKPIIPGIPVLPAFGGGGYGSKGGRSFNFGRNFKYQADLKSVLFNIKGKALIGKLTGFEARPIAGGFNAKPKRRRKR